MQIILWQRLDKRGTSKPRMAASIRRSRNIFIQGWEPIGVRDMNCPEDEYDGYVHAVYAILRQRRSQQAIVDYLRWAETERMEVDLPHDRLKAVAQKLLQIDVSQDELHE